MNAECLTNGVCEWSRYMAYSVESATVNNPSNHMANTPVKHRARLCYERVPD